MTGLPKSMHRGVWRYLGDRDILQAAAVTLLLLIASAGLLYVAHLVRVWHIARRSLPRIDARQTLLVFGRRLVRGEPEHDFIERLACAQANASDGLAERVLVLGGLSGGGEISEAEAGQRWLVAAGWPAGVPLLLEQQSVDSLENLRHAREILRRAGTLPTVGLVTNRYHLARCLYLARRLAFEATPVAAEPVFTLTPRYVKRMALEAGYLMWIDTGMRWAALTGNQRVLARIA
ncbi:YdcF family protein [Bacillus sp. NP157]|nr:YdcF family protein [Bacillus sp. NP157]